MDNRNTRSLAATQGHRGRNPFSQFGIMTDGQFFIGAPCGVLCVYDTLWFVARLVSCVYVYVCVCVCVYVYVCVSVCVCAFV